MTNTNEAREAYAAAYDAFRAAAAARDAAYDAYRYAAADAYDAAYAADDAYDAYRNADAYDAAIAAKKMTPKQAAFVAAYLDNGGNGSRAARDAGYSEQETNAALDATK